MNMLLHPISGEDEREIHPSRHQWDSYLLELLPVVVDRELTEHLEGCAQCQEVLEGLKVERHTFEEELNLAAFVHAVKGRKQAADASKGAGFRTWLRPWLWIPISSVAALFLVWLGAQRFSEMGSTVAPTMDASYVGVKGTTKPVLDVYLFRHSVRKRARSGGRFQSGDTLGFSYRGKGYRYLFMILVDQHGQISWLYPSGPTTSIPIAAQGQLKDSVELDGSSGQERLLSFFSKEPLSGKDIQNLLPKVQKTGVLQLPAKSKQPLFVHQFLLQK